jgi:hypothetical protein
MTPTVTVATLTYRRPAELARLLPLLVKQAVTLAPPARLVVIDNDPDGGAAEIVAGFAGEGVEYFHEPTPGIAAGRNRAIAEAAGADALVFIDDDETPSQDWLRLLVEQWRSSGADAVAGPVRRVFTDDVEDWVLATGVFARKVRPSGSRLAGAATSNLLLDLRSLSAHGLGFDERYGLTGGSDTMLSHALVKAGGQIVWCDEAEVCDPVPPARATREWVRARTVRTGNVWGRVEVDLTAPGAARLLARLRMVLLGLRLLVHGAAQESTGRLRGDQAQHAAGTVRRCNGVGVLSGAVGKVYAEYARPAQGRQR